MQASIAGITVINWRDFVNHDDANFCLRKLVNLRNVSAPLFWEKIIFMILVFILFVETSAQTIRQFDNVPISDHASKIIGTIVRSSLFNGVSDSFYGSRIIPNQEKFIILPFFEQL